MEPFFGICTVDAYMAYKYESEQAFSDPKDVDSFIAFIGKLGHQLIFNEYLEDGRTVCRHSNEEEVIEEATIILFLDVHVCICIIFSLHFRPMTVTLLTTNYVQLMYQMKTESTPYVQ